MTCVKTALYAGMFMILCVIIRHAFCVSLVKATFKIFKAIAKTKLENRQKEDGQLQSS